MSGVRCRASSERRGGAPLLQLHQSVFNVGKVFIDRCDVEASVAGWALHAGHAAIERDQVGVFSEDRVNKPLGADDLVELLAAK